MRGVDVYQRITREQPSFTFIQWNEEGGGYAQAVG